MKPIFNINNYKGKYCMHCNTQEKADIFCNYLDSVGKKWNGSVEYTDCVTWDIYKADTIYCFNEGFYRYVKYARHWNYTILEFDNFNWGQTVKIENGTIKISEDMLKQLSIPKGGTLNIHILDGKAIVFSQDAEDDKADWIKSHSERFKQEVSDGRAKYMISGKTIIAFFLDTEDFVKAQVSGNDVFDLDTGLAIICAKHDGEQLPDFILN